MILLTILLITIVYSSIYLSIRLLFNLNHQQIFLKNFLILYGIITLLLLTLEGMISSLTIIKSDQKNKITYSFILGFIFMIILYVK